MQKRLEQKDVTEDIKPVKVCEAKQCRQATLQPAIKNYQSKNDPYSAGSFITEVTVVKSKCEDKMWTSACVLLRPNTIADSDGRLNQHNGLDCHTLVTEVNVQVFSRRLTDKDHGSLVVHSHTD